MKDWSDRQEEYLQESLEQYRKGELTAHELIKDRGKMNIGKFAVLVVVTQIVIDLAFATLLALVIFWR